MIKPISLETLDTFYKEYSGDKTFLQSAPFARWRSALGETIHIFGIYQGDTLKGTALIQSINSRFKKYLHCPHGPLLDPQDQKSWATFAKWYKTFGQEQNVDLVRLAPLLSPETEIDTWQHHYRPAAIHMVNPELTLVLDITPSEEEILAQMRKSTRYEVRRIEKCGIQVSQGNSPKDLEIFWNLHTETVARQKFVPFPKSNTQAQLEAFSNDCLIFHAEVDQKFYSSSVIIFDHRSAYYHQGASIYSKAPCSHATIWAAIKEAKRRGCQYFNFWGIVDEHQIRHPWYGLSKFKKGFGGQEHRYIHVLDGSIHKGKTLLNRWIEQWRKWRRGY